MSKPAFRLGVLDQAPIPEGSTVGEALRNSVDLALCCDRLGYHRYWVAEHHGSPGLGCSSPEVLIGPIASATSRMRIGSGGVMLPHYSPLKVAENFSMLAGLFPGRIDLGVGRAAGTDPTTTLALQRDRRRPNPDDFPQQLLELLGLVEEAETAAPPPECWLLGSSPQSAVWAAELGLPYAFADFINAEGASSAHYYRKQFVPGTWGSALRTSVAVWAICAETEDESQRLVSSFRMMMTLLHRGERIAVPPIETALHFLEGQATTARTNLSPSRRTIVGTPSAVKAGIEAVAREYEADEVLLVNIVFEHAARKRSYELIAAAFELPGSERVRSGAES